MPLYPPPASAMPPEYRANGYKSWSVDPGAVSGAQNPTQGTGRVACVRVPWVATDSVTSIVVRVITAGATLTAGRNLAAIYTGAGDIIPNTTTADQSAVWAAVGVYRMALAGGPTVIAADALGYLWVAALTVGTTGPVFVSSAGSAVSFNGAQAAAPYRGGLIAATGLTAMPASLTVGTMTAFMPHVAGLI